MKAPAINIQEAINVSISASDIVPGPDLTRELTSSGLHPPMTNMARINLLHHFVAGFSPNFGEDKCMIHQHFAAITIVNISIRITTLIASL